jgi:hypothetical protein
MVLKGVIIVSPKPRYTRWHRSACAGLIVGSQVQFLSFPHWYHSSEVEYPVVSRKVMDSNPIGTAIEDWPSGKAAVC